MYRKNTPHSLWRIENGCPFVAVFSEGPWHAGCGIKCSDYGSSLTHLGEHKRYNPTYRRQSKEGHWMRGSACACIILTAFLYEQWNPYSSGVHRDCHLFYYFILETQPGHEFQVSNLKPRHKSSGIIWVNYRICSHVYVEGRKMRLKNRVNNLSKDFHLCLQSLCWSHMQWGHRSRQTASPLS